MSFYVRKSHQTFTNFLVATIIILSWSSTLAPVFLLRVLAIKIIWDSAFGWVSVPILSLFSVRILILIFFIVLSPLSRHLESVHFCPNSIVFLTTAKSFYVLCVSILYEYLHMYHGHAWCTWKLEEGIERELNLVIVVSRIDLRKSNKCS